MKLLLTAVRRIRKPHPCRFPRCLSSGAGSSGPADSGLLPLRDEELIVGSSRQLVQRLGAQVEVRANFISEEEEGALMQELEPGLRKKRYEFDHWDDVSHVLEVDLDVLT